MDDREWTCPDADDDGFVFFEILRDQAATLDHEEFLLRYPRPGLLVVYREPDSDGEVLDPTSSGVQLLTVSIKGTTILRYLGKVAFITKRPGNPFAHLISVGRSAKNDITVAVDSVSKVHGYFVLDGNRWCFTDHGSTNGSVIGNVELTSGRKYPLEAGDILRLGLEVHFEYLTPESLYRKARGSAG